MTTLAVATPAYLDLTFLGLEALPGPGQERFAAQLLRSGGGGAITATAAARLGLDTTLASPLGDDEAGAFIREALAGEGVATVAGHPGPTATTVIMPVTGDRAMVTYDPGMRARPEDIRALSPGAVVCGLDELERMPSDAWAYATCGDDDARRFAGEPPEALAQARALLLNEAEAALLTGGLPAAEAARELAGMVETVVVTRGSHGAAAIVDGHEVLVAGMSAGPVVDTTGAGDCFAAAFVWGDLHGADREARVGWATLYSAMSVTAPTGTGGAVTERELMEEGTRRGLPRHPPPAGHASSASPQKERYS